MEDLNDLDRVQMAICAIECVYFLEARNYFGFDAKAVYNSWLLERSNHNNSFYELLDLARQNGYER